jgi:CRISPR-associated protein Cmr2
MARYLITLSLGPVQSLIGAARRTRDLWSGSWLLAEVSRAAARVLHQAQPGCLIFPAPQDPERELAPRDRPGDTANIANILRAEVEGDADSVRALCAAAKAAAIAHLRQRGEVIRRELPGLRDAQWAAQIDDMLEAFAAWTPSTDGDYAAASARLGATLAARKATRDCGPARGMGAGLPKSSLDGACETVLPDKPKASLVRQLALQRGEQLDALGVIKRRGGEVSQFTAYSRLAADPWIDRLGAAHRQRLAAAYAPLVALDLATRISGNQGIYGDLPYDAQLLYDFRLATARGEARQDEDGAAVAVLQHLERELRAVTKIAGGGPVPYAVILQADGDRMGELLSRARRAGESRDISRALQGFANAVPGLVRAHRGHAIYAGGDDVLALLPLQGAVMAAQSLANAFHERLGAIAQRLGLAADQAPTLSVGLGIGHVVEPLGKLRERALRAEKLAKGDDRPPRERRNALGILLGIRSGGEIPWRARWDAPQALDELLGFVGAYQRQELPSRVAYDLRDIHRRLAWLGTDSGPTATGMRRAEVVRMLERARARGDALLTPEHRKHLLRRAAETPLDRLADTLIIARWLAARTQGDVENTQ